VFEAFSHYVSYGATDQQTIRELAGSIQGLVVPGTVAAFQRQGTGGFVLTLSATSVAPAYVIDSRFPLFQQRLIEPKASHVALAELLGHPELVRTEDPEPADFSQIVVESIATHWVEFNSGYTAQVSEKFDKYSERLAEPVRLPDARVPLTVLAPYVVAFGVDDEWWDVSKRLFEATQTFSPDTVRTVAASSPRVLSDVLAEVDDTQLVVWVSDLDELESEARTLAAYAAAIGEANSKGQATFGLYGGFFSVLLASQGLRGSSHGIGFGEYRNWIELPRSGPPPARYYLPILHRYVRPEVAYQVWLAAPDATQCRCAECDGAPPIALDYQALMKHSVLCRAEEVDTWTDLDAIAMADQLESDYDEFLTALDDANVPSALAGRAERAAAHMPRWSLALRLASE
jgi:hypothetical protein